MTREHLKELCEEVIDLDSSQMKLCGRQKCIELLKGLEKYIKDNSLNDYAATLGDITYGKIHLNEVIDFYRRELNK